MGRTRLRDFHQARWDEPVIFELARHGERGVLPPQAEPEITSVVGDCLSILPSAIRRESPPALPEISQMRVLKHYLHLSQHCLGADLNVDVGQGTCTMKYSPVVSRMIVASPKVTELHPLQDEGTVQGSLEIMHSLDLYLRELSGMDYFTFQPGGGSAAIFSMASLMHAYHEHNGQSQRDEIITTIFSHPSDAAAAAVKGYAVITLYPNDYGYIEEEALRQAVSPRTAGLFITNPEDTGIFNPHIARFTDIVHEAGGLCAYDQANANGILGMTRAREAGFDMCFFNLHKTFSSPHGCGGPACGALGVRSFLKDFLPVPLVRRDADKYSFDYDLPHTIGKVRSFYGVFPVLVNAYAWIRSLGEEGLRTVARIAVLNNNYMLKKINGIRGMSVPYAPGEHRIEQVRYSLQTLFEETGVTQEDVARRMADFGFHLWSSHHPFIVPQPMTIEPTESYSKDEIDEYLEGLRRVSSEAYSNPDTVRNAPHRSVVHTIDQSTFDDPALWAITWRAYLKKHGERTGK